MSVESLRRFIERQLIKYDVYPNPDAIDEILRILKFSGVPGREREEAKRIINALVRRYVSNR